MFSSLRLIEDINLRKPCMVPDLDEFRASGYRGIRTYLKNVSIT